MNSNCYPKIVRLGAGLTLLAALSAFAVRAAQAQTPVTGPQRLSLGEAARLAASQSAGVQGATYRVQQAKARVDEARSAFLPQISLTPNWTSHTVNSASFGFNFPTQPGVPPLLDPNGQIIGPVKMWDFRGNAAQTLYDPASRERVRAARAGVDVAQADVSTAAAQAATTAASAYVRAQRGEASIQARLADSSLAGDLLVIAREQLQAGVGVALDVTRAQSQLAGARAQLIAARNERNRARLDLARTLNLPLDTPIELTDSLAGGITGETTNEAAAIAAALSNRPELRALDAQLAAAQQQVNATRAQRLPTVGVFGNDGENGFINHLLNTYTYGVQLSWPIFEGGRREAQTQEQLAAVHEIEVRRRDVREQVTADVRTALLDLTAAQEQLDVARERQRLAEQEVEQARDRFRAGVAGNADVITASISLNTARTAVIDALTAYQAARVSLARAEGNVTQLR
jgi:outer membrane protein TolC